MLALASAAAPAQTRLGVFSGGWCRPARDPSRPPWARNLGPRAIISPLDNEVVVLGTSANLGDCEEQCEAKLGDNLACALWDGTGPAASCSCQSKAPESASLYDETQFCWSPRSGVESTVYLDAKPVNCGEHVECCTPATCEAEGWDMDCISNSSAVPVSAQPARHMLRARAHRRPARPDAGPERQLLRPGWGARGVCVLRSMRVAPPPSRR